MKSVGLPALVVLSAWAIGDACVAATLGPSTLVRTYNYDDRSCAFSDSGGASVAEACTAPPLTQTNDGVPFVSTSDIGATAEAHAEAGKVRAGATAEAIGNGPLHFQVQAYAQYQDEITITSGPAEGILSLDFHLEGFGTATEASSGLVDFGFLDGSGDRLFWETMSFSDDFTVDQIFTWEVPYTDSLVPIGIFIDTYLDCRLTGGSQACGASSNFLNSATIVGAEVLDTEMNPVPDAQLSATSGFDYLAASQQVSEIPLPPSLALFGGGLSLILLVGRRRARASCEATAA